MAVQTPDRSGRTMPAPLGEGVMGWLAWVSQLLINWTWIGVVEISSNDESMVHGFPQSIEQPLFVDQAARRACLSGKVVNIRLEPNHPHKTERCLLAQPLKPSANGFNRALLLKGATQSPEQLAATIKLCRWASVWLDQLPISTPLPTPSGSDSLADSVLNAVEKYGSATSVALAIVNAIKRQCGCKRVAIGFTTLAREAKGLKLIALSDQVQIDTKRILPAQIESAMSECLSEPGVCSYPNDQSLKDTVELLPAHAALFEDQGGCPSLSMVYPACGMHGQPDEAKDASVSIKSVSIVIVLERPAGQSFSQAQTTAIQSLLAPSLSLLNSLVVQEIGWLERMRGSVKQVLERGFYQRLSVGQWVQIVLCLVLLGTLVVPVPHRVSAHAAIQAKDLQVLIAPQSGFVSTSHVRAGDSVVKDQLLATLDARELQMSANKWRSEARKNQQALDRALATRDKTKLVGLRADAARIEAERALIESQVARTELKAPFDGVVLSGDLSQSLGAAVAQGDTLFMIASSDEYELILDVKESDVGLVSSGQQVRVRMAALPNESWQASVASMLPVAVVTSEANVFRVPAQLAEPSPRLRPGMEGVAKLYVGKRSLVWVYTRTLRDQFKLMLWRLGVIR